MSFNRLVHSCQSCKRALDSTAQMICSDCERMRRTPSVAVSLPVRSLHEPIFFKTSSIIHSSVSKKPAKAPTPPQHSASAASLAEPILVKMPASCSFCSEKAPDLDPEKPLCRKCIPHAQIFYVLYAGYSLIVKHSLYLIEKFESSAFKKQEHNLEGFLKEGEEFCAQHANSEVKEINAVIIYFQDLMGEFKKRVTTLVTHPIMPQQQYCCKINSHEYYRIINAAYLFLQDQFSQYQNKLRASEQRASSRKINRKIFFHPLKSDPSEPILVSRKNEYSLVNQHAKWLRALLMAPPKLSIFPAQAAVSVSSERLEAKVDMSAAIAPEVQNILIDSEWSAPNIMKALSEAPHYSQNELGEWLRLDRPVIKSNFFTAAYYCSHADGNLGISAYVLTDSFSLRDIEIFFHRYNKWPTQAAFQEQFKLDNIDGPNRILINGMPLIPGHSFYQKFFSEHYIKSSAEGLQKYIFDSLHQFSISSLQDMIKKFIPIEDFDMISCKKEFLNISWNGISNHSHWIFWQKNAVIELDKKTLDAFLEIKIEFTVIWNEKKKKIDIGHIIFTAITDNDIIKAALNKKLATQNFFKTFDFLMKAFRFDKDLVDIKEHLHMLKVFLAQVLHFQKTNPIRPVDSLGYKALQKQIDALLHIDDLETLSFALRPPSDLQQLFQAYLDRSIPLSFAESRIKQPNQEQWMARFMMIDGYPHAYTREAKGWIGQKEDGSKRFCFNKEILCSNILNSNMPVYILSLNKNEIEEKVMKDFFQSYDYWSLQENGHLAYQFAFFKDAARALPLFLNGVPLEKNTIFKKMIIEHYQSYCFSGLKKYICENFYQQIPNMLGYLFPSYYFWGIDISKKCFTNIDWDYRSNVSYWTVWGQAGDLVIHIQNGKNLDNCFLQTKMEFRVSWEKDAIHIKNIILSVITDQVDFKSLFTDELQKRNPIETFNFILQALNQDVSLEAAIEHVHMLKVALGQLSSNQPAGPAAAQEYNPDDQRLMDLLNEMLPSASLEVLRVKLISQAFLQALRARFPVSARAAESLLPVPLFQEQAIAADEPDPASISHYPLYSSRAHSRSEQARLRALVPAESVSSEGSHEYDAVPLLSSFSAAASADVPAPDLRDSFSDLFVPKKLASQSGPSLFESAAANELFEDFDEEFQ